MLERAPTYDMDEDFQWTPDYGRQVDLLQRADRLVGTAAGRWLSRSSPPGGERNTEVPKPSDGIATAQPQPTATPVTRRGRAPLQVLSRRRWRSVGCGGDRMPTFGQPDAVCPVPHQAQHLKRRRWVDDSRNRQR